MSRLRFHPLIGLGPKWLLPAVAAIAGLLAFALCGRGGGVTHASATQARSGPAEQAAARAVNNFVDEKGRALCRAFRRSTADGLAMYASLELLSSRVFRLRQLMEIGAISHEQAFLAAVAEGPDAQRDLFEVVFRIMARRGDLRALEFVDRIAEPQDRLLALTKFSETANIRSEGDAIAILRWAAERGEIERDGLCAGIWRIFESI